MSQALGQAQGIGNKIESLTPESLHLRMGSKRLPVHLLSTLCSHLLTQLDETQQSCYIPVT